MFLVSETSVPGKCLTSCLGSPFKVLRTSPCRVPPSFDVRKFLHWCKETFRYYYLQFIYITPMHCPWGRSLKPGHVGWSIRSSSRSGERAYGSLACCKATAGAGEDELHDQNQLQTALNTAIASEDYARASRLRDRIKTLLGEAGKSGLPADWQALGVLDWLASRAEGLGYRFPTGVAPLAPQVIGRQCHMHGVCRSQITQTRLISCA
eukprot:jgi/Botrbrau1/14114/Bobra.182_3s0057.1